jgi:hypothetical protein
MAIFLSTAGSLFFGRVTQKVRYYVIRDWMGCIHHELVPAHSDLRRRAAD